MSDTATVSEPLTMTFNKVETLDGKDFLILHATGDAGTKTIIIGANKLKEVVNKKQPGDSITLRVRPGKGRNPVATEIDGVSGAFAGGGNKWQGNKGGGGFQKAAYNSIVYRQIPVSMASAWLNESVNRMRDKSKGKFDLAAATAEAKQQLDGIFDALGHK